jgi:hypothetical protein
MSVAGPAMRQTPAISTQLTPISSDRFPFTHHVAPKLKAKADHA